jgi:hypothetical protein
MAKLDLLQHLEVINYVPVVIYLETGGYLVEAKQKDENGPYIIDYVSYLG